MTVALLSRGASAARAVLTVRSAEKQGAASVTYAYLSVKLEIDLKAVKRAVRKAGDFLQVENAIGGAGLKAKISTTAAGRAACEE